MFEKVENEHLEDMLTKLPSEDLVSLKWEIMRRPSQTPPDPLPYIWFLMGGRGSGKTLTGSHHMIEVAKTIPTDQLVKGVVRVALISETLGDVKKTMIEGDTGLRSIIPEDLEIAWNRSLGELKIRLPGPPYREVHFSSYSSESPALLRGPQHHIVWIDEPAKFKDANEEPTKADTTWSNMVMGARLGKSPHILVTGTPKPHKLIKYLINHPKCTTYRMSSMENEANLPEEVLEEMRRLPPTSRLARQEIYAEVLLDNPDAIITEEQIEQNRQDPAPEDLENEKIRLVLGYDPSMSDSADADEAGLVLAGFEKRKNPQTPGQKPEVHAYILEDLSGHYRPSEQTTLFAETIIKKRVPEAIIEQNQGSGFIFNSILTTFQAHQDVKSVTFRELKKKPTKAGTMKRWRVYLEFHDNRSPHTFTLHSIQAKIEKIARVELISIRYETGQIHHPTRGLTKCSIHSCGASLEDQLVLWDGQSKKSPDRMDAAVYTLLHIFGSEHALSSRRPATISTAKDKILPAYDPRSLQTPLTRKNPNLSRAAQAYSADLGGNSAESDRPRVAGPR